MKTYIRRKQHKLSTPKYKTKNRIPTKVLHSYDQIYKITVGEVCVCVGGGGGGRLNKEIRICISECKQSLRILFYDNVVSKNGRPMFISLLLVIFSCLLVTSATYIIYEIVKYVHYKHSSVLTL